MTTLRAMRLAFQLLGDRERRQAILLAGCLLLAGIAELASVAVVYPFLAVLADPAVVSADARVAWLHAVVGSPAPRDFLLGLGVVVLAVTVAANGLIAFTLWWQVRFIWRANHAISVRLLQRHLNRPYADFLATNTSVRQKQVLDETQALVMNTFDPAFTMIGRLAATVLIGTLLLVLSPWVTVVFFGVVGGGFGLAYLRMRRRLKESGRDSAEANQVRFKAVAEAFGAIKHIKVSGLEDAFHARYRPHSAAYSRHQTTLHVARRLPYYAMQTVAFGGMALLVVVLLALGYGVGQVLPLVGVIAVGGFRLLPAFQQILASIVAFRFNDPIIVAIHDELKAAPSARTLAIVPLEPRSEVRLERLSFAYRGAQRPTLEDVDVTIAARSSVAFVGRTGAGKSTLIDVLLGVQQATRGRLLVDGVVVDDSNRASWQRALGYVPQEIFLTDDTVAANIAFGVPAGLIDPSAVERAARAAQLHEFVMGLPQGYATSVGERGVRLSGGQRQRIGIARALYHDPPVLILDEATSDIDNRTEADITRAIEGLAGTKTIVMVAHRLTTVRRCDRIFVLEDGRVIGAGTYDELLRDSPRFRDLAMVVP